MAGASNTVHELNSVVRGQHAYKTVWTSLTDKQSKCIMCEDNEHDKHTVNNQL